MKAFAESSHFRMLHIKKNNSQNSNAHSYCCNDGTMRSTHTTAQWICIIDSQRSTATTQQPLCTLYSWIAFVCCIEHQTLVDQHNEKWQCIHHLVYHFYMTVSKHFAMTISFEKSNGIKIEMAFMWVAYGNVTL